MGLKIKLNVVNRCEYEENEDYREIIIKMPIEVEKLERDFRYLGLDYNKLSIKDTHVLNCEIIDTKDPDFAEKMSIMLSNIIMKSSEQYGYKTAFQDVKSMFNIIESLNDNDKGKILAVLEVTGERIHNMQDAIKYGRNLNCFEYYEDVNTYEEYAKKLITNRDVDIEEVAEYINILELGEAYVNGNEGIFTEQGLIFQTDYAIDKNVQRITKGIEAEEEFE